MKCPYCGASNASRVISTTHDARGGTRRRRECRQCGQRFSTYEYPVQTMPLVVKVNGSREVFDRDKLIRSIRMACAKRPVPASDIERLVDEIEARIRQLSNSEVASRLIGDMVVEGLRELDEIAYIRYVIVFRELNTLQAVHEEIERLLAHSAEKNGHGPKREPETQTGDPAAQDQLTKPAPLQAKETPSRPPHERDLPE